jgi:AAA+ superfamily predicted ATPase
LVFLYEVETLAVSRHRLSLEANPIDVHRATDATLAGMDRLTREHRNILLIATTNFPKALDSAILLRADHIEEIGLPTTTARQALGIALTGMMQDGEITRERAVEIARMLLRGNALKLYGWPDRP